MKQAKYSSLGLDVNFSVPSTIEEFDTNAKRVGACLDEATNNVIYRGSLAEFRENFCAKLEEVAKVDRMTKATDKKDDKGNPIEVYIETEADFVKRVVSTTKKPIESWQSLADEVAKAIVFDASQRERKPAAPKKLGADYKATAEKVIANKNQAKLVALVAKDLGETLVLKNDASDVETIGWAIKRHQDWKRKQEMDSYSVGAAPAKK